MALGKGRERVQGAQCRHAPLRCLRDFGVKTSEAANKALLSQHLLTCQPTLSLLTLSSSRKESCSPHITLQFFGMQFLPPGTLPQHPNTPPLSGPIHACLRCWVRHQDLLETSLNSPSSTLNVPLCVLVILTTSQSLPTTGTQLSVF